MNEGVVEMSVRAVIAGISMADDVLTMNLDELTQIALRDPVYNKLLNKFKNKSFAHTTATGDPDIRSYFNVRDRLNVVDNLILYTFEEYNPRIVIPPSLQGRVCKKLHAAHQGVSTIMTHARQTVYWPGIERSLEQETNNCQQCCYNAKSHNKEPFIPSLIPQYPMQLVVCDLFQYNDNMYLIYACRLTGWVELAYFSTKTTSSAIVSTFREFFHRWGIPDEIALDGASNLSSRELTDFLRRWSIHRRLSSAYYPQSNGRAEAAVKSMKRLIRGHCGAKCTIDTEAMTMALLQYRNTPIQNSVSLLPN